jgi:hypothetical protein
MPTFAPPELRQRIPRAYRRKNLSGVSPLIYFHRSPVRRHRTLAGLGAQELAPVNAPGTNPLQSWWDSLFNPPAVNVPPPPPSGWDTGNPTVGFVPAPLSPSVPTNANAGQPIQVQPGTMLTYSVTYALTGLGNFFTSNQDAIASAAQMMAGAGLNVVNSQTPASANPFSNNSAVLTLEVSGPGFASMAQAKQLADNAFSAGVGSQIISSSLTQGAPNQAFTWLSQNWQLVAVGAAALLILPKILRDFL